MYYSKLALIELCGWIEVTMDKIVKYCASRHLSEDKNLDSVEKRVIGQTYGFAYGPHFRDMLMRVIGLVKLEELEGVLDPTKFHVMKSSLGTLRQQRDQEAHTYIAGTTHRLAAPSVTMGHFQSVYVGLKDVEMCIRRLKM